MTIKYGLQFFFLNKGQNFLAGIVRFFLIEVYVLKLHNYDRGKFGNMLCVVVTF
jgi:hypothetical protein